MCVFQSEQRRPLRDRFGIVCRPEIYTSGAYKSTNDSPDGVICEPISNDHIRSNRNAEKTDFKRLKVPSSKF